MLRPLQQLFRISSRSSTMGTSLLSQPVRHTHVRIHHLTKEQVFENVCKMFASFEGNGAFNELLHVVKPVDLRDNNQTLVCTMVVEKRFVNGKGTFHGGMMATMTDVITAETVRASHTNKIPTSVELAVSYFAPAQIGDTIEIHAKVLKVGRSLAFAEAEFINQSTGKLVAKGKHTIALLDKR